MWRRLVWAPEDGQVDVDGWAPYTPHPRASSEQHGLMQARAILI